MATRRPYTNAPTDRATQWQDLSPASHRVLNANVRANGQQKDALQANIDAQRSAAIATPDPKRQRLYERQANNLTKIAPYVRNVDVTHASAAKRRVDLFTAAGERAEGEGRSAPRGYGWYFEHHGAIAGVAKQYGFDSDRAIVASAAMSPQNTPANEKTAVTELMKMHAANPTINLTPKGAKFLGVGNRSQVSAHELTPEQIGKLGDAKHRAHISVGGGVNQVRIAAGGTQGNIAKAWNILHGTGPVATEDAVDPRSGAKVHSYTNNIRGAVPNSPVHDEYMARLRDYQDPTQGRLNLYGYDDHSPSRQVPGTFADAEAAASAQAERHKAMTGAYPQHTSYKDNSDKPIVTNYNPTNPLGPARNRVARGFKNNPVPERMMHTTKGTVLDPTGGTAEDTWMNSISMGQPLRAEGRTSIGKIIGSIKGNLGLNRTATINGQTVNADIDPSVKRDSLRHAWNNRATQIAAKHLSKSMDTRLPAVAAQEVSWTEARIQAGKGIEYNAEMKDAGKALKSTARSASQAATTNDQLHQGGFFKGVQGSLQVNRKHLPPAAHQEGGRR